VITDKRVAARIAELEAELAVLRSAVVIMNGHARVKKNKRAGSVLDQAVAVDGARRKGRGLGVKKYPPKVAHQREDTAKALAVIAAAGAMTSDAIVAKTGVKPGWIGPMRSRGYLKAGPDDTYVRTKKVFEVQPGR